MDLPIALESLLATLTTKTTLIGTDGVMTITASNGTPNGKMTIPNFASQIGIINRVTLSSSDNLNDCRDTSATYVWSGNAPLNAPYSYGVAKVLSADTGNTAYIQICFYRSTGIDLRVRHCAGGSWSNWAKVALDVPAFYNSYADLTALATGIMGQTISSITAAYFQGTIAQAVFDNVFIAVTRLSDTYPLAVKPKDWSSYSAASAYHVDGVLLVSGDKHLVIAPTEANLRWGADADSHAASGNTATSDRDTAMATFDGKSRTNTAVQVSEYADVTTACGYCHAFTTVTSAYDTTKTAYARRKVGMWWLTSLGEMMMIWSNMTKINQVMSLIGGTPLAETYYWTSTEHSQAYAWALNLSLGSASPNTKKTTALVRPVAAF